MIICFTSTLPLESHKSVFVYFGDIPVTANYIHHNVVKCISNDILS